MQGFSPSLAAGGIGVFPGEAGPHPLLKPAQRSGRPGAVAERPPDDLVGLIRRQRHPRPCPDRLSLIDADNVFRFNADTLPLAATAKRPTEAG